jgi:hypothetical protein
MGSPSALALHELPGLAEDEKVAKELEHRITCESHVLVKRLIQRWFQPVEALIATAYRDLEHF